MISASWFPPWGPVREGSHALNVGIFQITDQNIEFLSGKRQLSQPTVAQSISCVHLFTTPRITTCKNPLSPTISGKSILAKHVFLVCVCVCVCVCVLFIKVWSWKSVNLGTSRVVQLIKNLPAMLKTWVLFLSRRRKWQPTPVFLPAESHRQRSLAGHCP